MGEHVGINGNVMPAHLKIELHFDLMRAIIKINSIMRIPELSHLSEGVSLRNTR